MEWTSPHSLPRENLSLARPRPSRATPSALRASCEENVSLPSHYPLKDAGSSPKATNRARAKSSIEDVRPTQLPNCLLPTNPRILPSQMNCSTSYNANRAEPSSPQCMTGSASPLIAPRDDHTFEADINAESDAPKDGLAPLCRIEDGVESPTSLKQREEGRACQRILQRIEDGVESTFPGPLTESEPSHGHAATTGRILETKVDDIPPGSYMPPLLDSVELLRHHFQPIREDDTKSDEHKGKRIHAGGILGGRSDRDMG